MAHTSDCVCGANWRIVCCDLVTGLEKAVLHPVSADFQLTLNQVGTGTLTLPTRDVVMRDIWPHATSVYITRIAGGSAAPDNPVAEFAGLVEQVSSTGDGTTTVGLQSIEKYLDHRLVTKTTTFSQESPTVIAKRLTDTAIGAANLGLEGLRTTATKSATKRVETIYNDYDWKIIGEAIREQCEMEPSIDYELRHLRDSGRWSTEVIFRDRVGADRGVVLVSDRNLGDYGLDVDAATQANSVHAIGSGDGAGQLNQTAEDVSAYPFYPKFEAAPAYTDTTLTSTLKEQAEGYLADYGVPVTIPRGSLYGVHDPDPATVRVGDTVTVDVAYGAATFYGQCRVQSISWNLSADQPETRSLDLLPGEPGVGGMPAGIPTGPRDDKRRA